MSVEIHQRLLAANQIHQHVKIPPELLCYDTFALWYINNLDNVTLVEILNTVKPKPDTRRPVLEGKHKRFNQNFYPMLRKVKNNPEYSVCDTWQDPHTFNQWLYETETYGEFFLHQFIDPNNKHFSPETCVMVTKELASLLRNTPKSKATGVRGVSKSRASFIAYLSKEKVFRSPDINQVAQAYFDNKKVKIQQRLLDSSFSIETQHLITMNFMNNLKKHYADNSISVA